MDLRTTSSDPLLSVGTPAVWYALGSFFRTRGIDLLWLVKELNFSSLPLLIFMLMICGVPLVLALELPTEDLLRVKLFCLLYLGL